MSSVSLLIYYAAGAIGLAAHLSREATPAPTGAATTFSFLAFFSPTDRETGLPPPDGREPLHARGWLSFHSRWEPGEVFS